MRRGNMNRSGRGNNIGGNRGRGGSGNNNGPLLTNHLRDLDLELELLQRKRQIFEQEHSMLDRMHIGLSNFTSNNSHQYSNMNYSNNSSNTNKRQYSNTQPSYAYDQQGSSKRYNTTYYSYPYEEGPGPSNVGSKRSGNTSIWDRPNSSPPKQYKTTPRINPWQNPDDRQEYIPINQSSPRSKNLNVQTRYFSHQKPSIGQRINKKYNPPAETKNFKPSKVTKPNPKPFTKGSVYRPSEETKRLIDETNKFIAHTNQLNVNDPKTKPQTNKQPKVSNAKHNSEEDNILRSYKQPVAQVKGRLELALGMILKSIKELCTNPSTMEYLMIPFVQRIIKQTLRTRLRNVMLNLPVTTSNDVLDKYRQKYPKETDNEFLKLAQDADEYNKKNHEVLHFIESDDPEEFFKKNLSKMLEIKLDKLFSEISALRENKEYNIDECVELFATQTEASESIEGTNDSNKSGEIEAEGETDANIEKNLSEKEKSNKPKRGTQIEVVSADVKSVVDQLEARTAKSQKYLEFIDKLIEQRLPHYLARFKDTIISILCIDRQYFNIKTSLHVERAARINKIMENKKMADETTIAPQLISEKPAPLDESMTEPTDVATTEKSTAQPTPTTAAEQVSPAKPVTETITENPETATTAAKPVTAAIVVNPVTTTIAAKPVSTTTIAAKPVTATIEPEPVTATSTTNSVTASAVAKPLNAIENSVTATSATAKEKPTADGKPTTDLAKSTVKPGSPASVKSTTIATPGTPVTNAPNTPRTPVSKDIHYVKLIGCPVLPARAVIYEFLKQFNPSSIKKHKSINNLLVIGFTDRENVEKILAANESVVGDSKIIIKASEQVSTPVQIKTIQQGIKTPIGNKINGQDNEAQSSERGEQKTADPDQVQDKTNDQMQTNADQSDLSKNPEQSDTSKNVDKCDTLKDDEQSDTSKDDLLSTDLDAQITDLLSSIRKADEDKSDVNEPSKSNDVEKMDTNLVNEKSELTKISEDNSDEITVSKETAATNLNTIMEVDETANKPEDVKAKAIEEVAKSAKESGRATPTRSSSRIANVTPSTIRTRRASRLANNN